MTLDEAILHGGQNVPVCFLFIKKAFPSVRRSSLLKALDSMGVSGPIWNVIFRMYEHNESVVVVANSESTSYTVANGIREGTILSPLLYIIFLNELPAELRNTGLGITLPLDLWCGALAYADDLVLVG